MQVRTVGLDLAKNIFQVHGVDDRGEVVLQKRLRRRQVRDFFRKLDPCLIGMEACSTTHFWARELLSLGHDVRIIPPSYVKPYVRRGKNDAIDAAAICEAVSRPHMRFVPIKTEAQQAALMLHKTRELLVRQRVMLLNALRSHMAEFGIVSAHGRENVDQLILLVEDDNDESLPLLAKRALRPLVAQLLENRRATLALDAEVRAWHRQNEISKLLETIPGIGVLTASAIAAAVPDPAFFKSAREFSAWLGLVPKQNSSGGKESLGQISKQGNRYIRKLLVIGATSMLRRAKNSREPWSDWVNNLLLRRCPRLVTVAMANKAARIAWALMVKKQVYRQPAST